MIDDAGIARAIGIADVIDRYVAADVDLATSAVGMGLDALGTALRSKPAEMYRDLAPLVALAADVLAYVETGMVGPTIAERFGDLIAERSDEPLTGGPVTV